MLSSISWSGHVRFGLILFGTFLIIFLSSNRLTHLGRRIHSSFRSFEYKSINDSLFEMNTLVWTHEGTGFMKYIQWILTRKLSNIKISRLDNNCEITQKNYFYSHLTSIKFIHVFLIPLTADLTDNSKCSKIIIQIAHRDVRYFHHIYFKRRSIKATIFYQNLDAMRNNNYHTDIISSNISILGQNIEQASYTTEKFPIYFTFVENIKWKIIYSEDLVQSNLDECEIILTDFFKLLGLNISTSTFNDTLRYDSHLFIQESIWWDRSEVAEETLMKSFPVRPSTFTYLNDFYHLHGKRSFLQYLSDNRQCFTEGIFAQMQSETMLIHHHPIDKLERCFVKQFDCAFSDLYTFADREHLYQQFPSFDYFNLKPLKCGFAIPSIFDQVRKRYGRNHTCQTIVYTAVSNCYDPLPTITGEFPSVLCFVALLDTKTTNAYKQFYSKNIQSQNSKVQWDLIDLGPNTSPFRIMPKSSETLRILGQRMFPLAKWIIWLDGKARIVNITEMLTQAWTPITGAPHPDPSRTSMSEIDPTIALLSSREEPHAAQLKITLEELKTQEEEYRRDGFYSRSAALELKMFDIATFLYRNNHPCVFRYLCAWHNEINYYSYRGQLSVYYPAVRLNLTDYLDFLPKKFSSTVVHQSVC